MNIEQLTKVQQELNAANERINELEAELLRQRTGLVNLIDLEIIKTSYVDSAMIEIMSIDNTLNKDKS